MTTFVHYGCLIEGYEMDIFQFFFFFFQAEDGIRDVERSRGLGDVYKRQVVSHSDIIRKPGPEDWLSNMDEDGQTFGAFQGCFRNVPDKTRNALYIQPFEGVTDSSLLSLLRVFQSTFFMGMNVKIRKPIMISSLKVPSRLVEGTSVTQYLSTAIIETLAKTLPKDAYAMLALTTEDLYPREESAWCFGQASKTKRVGVFSIARYGLYGLSDANQVSYNLVRVMIHETAHMFGFKHCLYYRCVMNGAISAEEESLKPLCMNNSLIVDLCPVCLRKLQDVLKFDIEKYISNMNSLLNSMTIPQFASDAKWFSSVITSFTPSIFSLKKHQ
eukprot:TRINITY_DN6508_c0_g1_i2.p1 TRINITY_DN6508_c0_g1~~TRINITY_DN6508_c0_g1_i2.p1  ORF type:complete len:328 (-),score=39.78 TRINITY_DN6508_c0_g1_i2:134-1117(-)